MSSSNINQTVSEIIEKLKRDGIFDAFRKECLADVDSKVWLNYCSRRNE